MFRRAPPQPPPIPPRPQKLEYDALPTPSSIRLLSVLRVEPDNGKRYEGKPPIECVMHTVDLRDEPAYRALSYTWGNPFTSDPGPVDDYHASRKYPVTVNGKLLGVTRNLYEALEAEAHGDFHTLYDRPRPPYFKNLLVEAAERGAEESVQQLLGLNSNVGATDCFGSTALHYAAENGHTGVVRLLLDAGSDPYATDGAGRTPAARARQHRRGSYGEVRWLLQAYAQRGARPPRPRSSAPLWIDAICINQEDVSERSAQVSIMGPIYQSALGVVVWLGIETEESTFHLTGMEELVNALWDAKRATSKPNRAQDSHQPLKSFFKSDEAVARFRSFRSFFRRSWFRRIWIVQEVFFAKSITVRCGSLQLSWQEIISVLTSIDSQDKQQSILSDIMPPMVRFRKGSEALALLQFRHLTREEFVSRFGAQQAETQPFRPLQERIPLSISLLWTSNFLAGDPRDRIFALLGTAEDLPTEYAISPDYTLSTAEVYTRIGAYFMQERKRFNLKNINRKDWDELEPLEALSFVQTFAIHPDQRTRDLPSWVPDFSSSPKLNRIYHQNFHASGDRKPIISPSPSLGVLRVSALEIDEVIETERRMLRDSAMKTLLADPEPWYELVLKMGQHFPAGKDHVEALLQAAAVGNGEEFALLKDIKGPYISSRLLAEPQHKLNDLRARESIAYQKIFGPSMAGMPNVEPGLGKPEQEFTFVDMDLFSLARPPGMHHYRYRKLFLTKAGRVGLGPATVQRGDRVFVMAGGRVPYILRDRDDGQEGWRLVGESYVYGIMFGEAVRDRLDDFRAVDIT